VGALVEFGDALTYLPVRQLSFSKRPPPPSLLLVFNVTFQMRNLHMISGMRKVPKLVETAVLWHVLQFVVDARKILGIGGTTMVDSSGKGPTNLAENSP
jgi:hypothetical protein